jgi:hypothetical protein
MYKNVRYTILLGADGYYIYDYKLYDVVKKDGKYFLTEKKSEAKEFLQSLHQEELEKPI